MRRHLTVAILALGLATSAGAAPITYTAVLSGANEDPQNLSPATGTATVILDLILHTLEVSVDFMDLTAPASAAHIHCCTGVAGAGNIGVAVPASGFPVGATSGSYDHTFDTTSSGDFGANFLNTFGGGTAAGAEAALAAGIAAGKAYVNIHSTVFPSGEIRGFLTPVVAPVPEPASLALVGLGLVGAAMRRRRAR